jgi:hypothetical protein
MSTFQAVATVTAALRQRLLETVLADVPAATVTTLRPADPGTNGIPAVGVNLFLFAVHVSAAHRNRDLPVRSGTGDTLQVPVIPLELDYLVSFYGDANGAAHQLVGSVMRSLYARPILTATMIQAVETAATGLNSGLANQADRVRLTPLTLPIEEIAKLWTVFFQSSYALSVAFRASPVMIEADQPLVIAPPVATPQLGAFPLIPPRIVAVAVLGAAPNTPITPGSTIVVMGTNFDPATAQLIIAGTPTAPGAATPTSLTATLNTALPAGETTLQVQQSVPVGAPPVLRLGPASAPFTVLLQPVVTQTAGAFAIAVTNETGSGTAPRSATVSIGLTPAVGPTQTVSLALLDLTGATQHVFRAADRTASAATITFTVTNIAAGTYVARVTVDGANTPVVTDTGATSPTKGQFIPQVAFP